MGSAPYVVFQHVIDGCRRMSSMQVGVGISVGSHRGALRTSMVACRCAQQQTQHRRRLAQAQARLVRLQCAQLLSAHTEALTASIRTCRANEQVRAAPRRTVGWSTSMRCLMCNAYVVWYDSSQRCLLSLPVAYSILSVACCLGCRA
jgi:hypothetical protein